MLKETKVRRRPYYEAVAKTSQNTNIHASKLGRMVSVIGGDKGKEVKTLHLLRT